MHNARVITLPADFRLVLAKGDGDGYVVGYFGVAREAIGS